MTSWLKRRAGRRTAGFAVVLAVALAGLLVACSSSGAGGAASPSLPASSPSPSGSPGSSSASGKPPKPLRASDVKAIKHAYETFFNGKTSVATSVKLLQNGTKLKATLAQQATSPTAKALSAKVVKVTRAPNNSNPKVAQAMFELLENGKTLLPPTPGYAVQDHGKWKVSAATFCQLLTLQQSAPPQCSDASVTAFPGG